MRLFCLKLKILIFGLFSNVRGVVCASEFINIYEK